MITIISTEMTTQQLPTTLKWMTSQSVDYDNTTQSTKYNGDNTSMSTKSLITTDISLKTTAGPIVKDSGHSDEVILILIVIIVLLTFIIILIILKMCIMQKRLVSANILNAEHFSNLFEL